MSDRKYRQRGYQDEREPRRPAPEQPQKPPVDPRLREPRRPNMPGFREVVRCAQCGGVTTPSVMADARCSRCGADLHTCAQCASFDPGSRFECTQAIPARVAPKNARNACTYFEPRVTVERETGSTGPTDARKAFDDLFK